MGRCSRAGAEGGQERGVRRGWRSLPLKRTTLRRAASSVQSLGTLKAEQGQEDGILLMEQGSEYTKQGRDVRWTWGGGPR